MTQPTQAEDIFKEFALLSMLNQSEIFFLKETLETLQCNEILLVKAEEKKCATD